MHLPSNDGNYELPPEGNHAATCYRFIDLGTQEETFPGKPARQKHKVLLSWELPGELMESGEPFSVHKRYTWSSSPKSNLRKDLESWRGKRFEDSEIESFDVRKLLGAACMLQIVHANDFANIATIASLPKGMAKPSRVNPSVYFAMDQTPDFDVFDSFSESLREAISKSPEYRKHTEQPPIVGDDPVPATSGDDIPF